MNETASVAKIIVDRVFNHPDQRQKIKAAFTVLTDREKIGHNIAIGWIAIFAQLPPKLVKNVVENLNTKWPTKIYELDQVSVEN